MYHICEYEEAKGGRYANAITYGYLPPTTTIVYIWKVVTIHKIEPLPLQPAAFFQPLIAVWLHAYFSNYVMLIRG